MLTAKQRKWYTDSDGGGCPHCRSTNIEGGPIDIGGGSASQEVSCLDCDEIWQDVYELVRIEEIG